MMEDSAYLESIQRIKDLLALCKERDGFPPKPYSIIGEALFQEVFQDANFCNNFPFEKTYLEAFDGVPLQGLNSIAKIAAERFSAFKEAVNGDFFIEKQVLTAGLIHSLYEKEGISNDQIHTLQNWNLNDYIAVTDYMLSPKFNDPNEIFDDVSPYLQQTDITHEDLTQLFREAFGFTVGVDAPPTHDVSHVISGFPATERGEILNRAAECTLALDGSERLKLKDGDNCVHSWMVNPSYVIQQAQEFSKYYPNVTDVTREELLQVCIDSMHNRRILLKFFPNELEKTQGYFEQHTLLKLNALSFKDR